MTLIHALGADGGCSAGWVEYGRSPGIPSDVIRLGKNAAQWTSGSIWLPSQSPGKQKNKTIKKRQHYGCFRYSESSLLRLPLSSRDPFRLKCATSRPASCWAASKTYILIFLTFYSSDHYWRYCLFIASCFRRDLMEQRKIIDQTN